MNEDDLDAWVREVVDAAPLLTGDQRTRLAELLRPVRVDHGSLLARPVESAA